MSQTTSENGLSSYAPTILSIARIIVGLIFIEHGTQKLLGFPTTDHMPPAFTLMWFGGIIETVGGFFIALGLFTKPAAFIASGEMAFAYFMFHSPRSFFPALNQGDAAILYCFFFLYLVFRGPGPLSLDALLTAKKADRH